MADLFINLKNNEYLPRNNSTLIILAAKLEGIMSCHQ